ncbi:MAG TPA: hypothetical protein VK194_01170 [Candidatus Deferrimicrobium sp.]|nr:hypothetical protein [Candidatus Deferrimicrobium sp.]
MDDLLSSDRVATAALTPQAAAWAGTLPEAFPGDRIDRLLYATALDLRVPFVTKDDRLRAAVAAIGSVPVVW